MVKPAIRVEAGYFTLSGAIASTGGKVLSNRDRLIEIDLWRASAARLRGSPRPSGMLAPVSKFNEQQIATIKRRLREGEPVDSAADDFATTRRVLRDHPEIGGYVDARGRHRIVFSEGDRKLAQGLALAGQTNKMIARALDISADTLARHLGPDIVRWRADQVAIAGTSLTRAAGMGSVPAARAILRRAETGSWHERTTLDIGAPSDDALLRGRGEVCERIVGRLTSDERRALRVVAEAAKRIAAAEGAGSSLVDRG